MPPQRQAAITTPWLAPQLVPVPVEVPTPVIQQPQEATTPIAAALRGRGTYANDFSGRQVQQYIRTPA